MRHHPHDRRRAHGIVALFVPLLLGAAYVVPLQRFVGSLIGQTVEPAWLRQASPDTEEAHPVLQTNVFVPDATEAEHFSCFRADGLKTMDRSACGEEQSTWFRNERGLPETMGAGVYADFERSMDARYGNGGARYELVPEPMDMAYDASTALEALLVDETIPSPHREQLQEIASELTELLQRPDLLLEEVQSVIEDMIDTAEAAGILSAGDAAYALLLQRSEHLLLTVIPERLRILRASGVSVAEAENVLVTSTQRFPSLSSGCSGGSLHACGEIAEILQAITTELYPVREAVLQLPEADSILQQMHAAGSEQ